MNRRKKVLKLIVKYFIKNVEPVESNTLINEYSLDYLSATIRSEMNGIQRIKNSLLSEQRVFHL